MHTLSARHPYVNLRALDIQARAQLGELWLGASTRGGELIAYLAEGASKDALAQAQALLDAHDPHREGDMAEEAPPATPSALLQDLLERVARLERALAELQAIK
jgi:uncharacterized phage protein gp47/JayE